MNLSTKVNNIALILLVSLFLFTPFNGFLKVVVLGVLLIVWFISAHAINRDAMRQTQLLWIMLFFLMFIQWMLSSFPGNEDQFRRFFTQNLWTYIWGILGVYYASNINLFKKYIPFVVVMISVSCIYTIVGNLKIPGASRMLAGYLTEGMWQYTLVHKMNIGGYGFIYALVFAVIPCSLWIKQLRSKRYLSITFLILLFATLVVGSYFTSICLAIVSLVFCLTNTKNISTFVLSATLLTLILIAFKDSILQGLIDFGSYIDSRMLQTRARQMLEGSYQQDANYYGFISRWDRFINGIQNICDSPIFGRMTSAHLHIRPSSHSELLGYFERFGIFGSLPIFYFFFIGKKFISFATSREMELRFSFFFALFFIFITLDTFDVANPTGCMVFFIAPCTMLYLDHRDARLDTSN